MTIKQRSCCCTETVSEVVAYLEAKKALLTRPHTLSCTNLQKLSGVAFYSLERRPVLMAAECQVRGQEGTPSTSLSLHLAFSLSSTARSKSLSSGQDKVQRHTVFERPLLSRGRQQRLGGTSAAEIPCRGVSSLGRLKQLRSSDPMAPSEQLIDSTRSGGRGTPLVHTFFRLHRL